MIDIDFDTIKTPLMALVVRDEHEGPYKPALLAARASFDKAMERLRAIEAEQIVLTHEIQKLRRTITALAAMCSDPGSGDWLGITDAVTEVMTKATTTVSTTDVVKALEDVGFDLTTQKNAAASAHTVLTRLEKAGKVQRIDEGKTIKWRGPNFDPDDVPF